jgi:hypothetical protein
MLPSVRPIARRRAWTAAAAVAVALSAHPGAQTPAMPERFTAFAVSTGAPAPSAAGTVDITIDRYSTDADEQRLLTTLAERGPDKLLDLLSNMPRLGNIKTPDTLGYDLRFARRTLISDGAERIVIVTDRPIGFWEASRQPRVSDYPFTVIEMHIAPNGKGEGKMSVATRIELDPDRHTLVLENYTSQPVMLNEIRRVK